jgi:hypothetical protein
LSNKNESATVAKSEIFSELNKALVSFSLGRQACMHVAMPAYQYVYPELRHHMEMEGSSASKCNLSSSGAWLRAMN